MVVQPPSTQVPILIVDAAMTRPSFQQTRVARSRPGIAFSLVSVHSYPCATSAPKTSPADSFPRTAWVSGLGFVYFSKVTPARGSVLSGATNDCDHMTGVSRTFPTASGTVRT